MKRREQIRIGRPTRILLILLVLTLNSLPGTASDSGPIKLIAHRGGVVDELHPENSLSALEEAIRRGYWMVEVDIRRSSDGRLVVHHDEDFRRFYGEDRKVFEMTWNEILKLRSQPGNHRPIEFREVAEACKGRIALMIDTKGTEHPQIFFQSMETALRENDLLETAFFIGTPQSKAFFKGKARIAINREELKQTLADNEDVSRLYFLFEHGNRLDEATILLARSVGVPIVPSVNIFHYAGQDHWVEAERDIRRLLDLGVTYFQIDSVYDIWLRE